MADANDVFAEFNSLGQDNPGGSSDPNDVFDEFNSLGDDQSSAIGAFARGAAKGFLPTVGGLGAGILAGAAATPFTSPVGGIAAGLGAGIATSTAISKAQDYLLDKLGWTDRAQEAADRAQHPIASELGEMAPAALTLRPTGSMLQRAAGAGIGGIAAGANDLLSNGSIDWKHVAEGAGMGAAFPSLNKAGEAIEGVGARLGARLGGKAIPETKSATAGPPPNPEALSDVEEDTAAPPQEPTPQTPPDPELQVAQQQLASLDPEDALYKQWSDYVRGLTERTPDTGSPLYDPDAMLGPAGDENTFTPADSDRANDITTYARGIAAENPPAPEIEGAGNPVGAPMLARQAQRPSGDQRDYRKAAAAFAEVPGESSTPMTTGDQKPDVAAALTVDQPQTGFDQQTVRKPPEPQPAPQPAAEPAVEDAYQQYIREIEQQQGAQARPAEVQQRGPQPQVTPAPQPQVTPAPQPELTPQGGRRVLPDLTQQPVTAAVTPQQVQQARARLQSLGMDKMLTAFDNSSPEEQAQAVPHILERTANLRKQRVTDTGVAYKDEADRTRKEGSTKAVQTAMDELDNTDLDTEHTPENKKAIIDHATALYERAKELFGGNDPVHPKSGGYYPKVGARTPAQTLVYKARSVAMAKKPSWAQLEEYVTQLQTRGETGANVDAELERKPNRSTDNEGDMAPTSRQEYGATQEMADDHGTKYADDYQELADWMNHLTSDEHAFLADRYDLDAEMADPQDPAELRNTFQQDLLEGNQKRPGRIELVPSEEGAGRSRKIATREDIEGLDTNPNRFTPTSGEGRSLKTDPAYADLVAKYSAPGVEKPKTLGLGALEMPDAPDIRSATVDGSDKSFFDKINDFASNEGAGGPVPQSVINWLKNTTSYFSPRAAAAATHAAPSAATNVAKSYGDELGGWFTRMGSRMSRQTADLIGNLQRTPRVSAADANQVYNAMEDRTTGTLPNALQNWYTSYIKPVTDQYAPKYDELRDLMIKYELPGWQLMPERKDLGNGFTSFVSRIRKDDPMVNEGNDPFTGKTLSPWAPTTQPRDFRVLQNSQGDRIVFKPGDDNSQITLWRNGKPQPLKITTAGFDPSDLGSTIKLKVGGTPDTWTVSHAKADEITQATGGDVQYHKNPAYTASLSLNGLNNALERARMFRDVVESPEFPKMTATTRAGLDELKGKYPGVDFAQTKLPQFDKHWMPKQWAWIMDDYNRRGLFHSDTLDNLSMMAAKTFLMFGPQIHTLNEADKWMTSRGFKWITPSGWGKLVQTAPTAIKAAYTLDPAIYKEITDAGGNPMAIHAVARNAAAQMAKLTGVDIARNPSMWDVFGRLYGLSTPQLAEAAYQKSSGFMWRTTDALYIQRYLEEKANGYSPEDAVKRVEQFIDNYQMAPTIGGSRFAQQFLSTPGISYFAPYHYGVFRSWANIAKNLAGPAKSTNQRMEAAGQLMVQLALAYAFYPAVSAAYQKVSGNDNAEFRPRGMSTVPHAISQVAQGKSGVENLARDVWMPSVPAQMAMEGVQNRDWRGQPIVTPPDPRRTKVGNVVRGAGQAADWAARSTIAPYNTLSYAATAPGGSLAAGAKRFAEDQANIHSPSPAEVKRDATIDRINTRIAKGRDKRPGGLLESFTNRLSQGFADGGTVKPQPDVTAAVTKGTQLAMRRPIVTTPMPSGADSATNLSGPVYVDPRVPPPLRRPVAVHETVEQLLMSMGMSYPQAHKIATQAEKVAVLRAGGNWERYEAQWRGILDATEKERLSARQTPKGLHVNPMSAIGKSGGGHAVHQER